MRSIRGVTVTAVVGAMVLSFAGPVSAEDVPATDPLAALSVVSEASSTPATDLLGGVAAIATDAVGSSAIDATVGGVDVTVPTDPSIPLSIDSGTSGSISVVLPFSNEADSALVVQEGVVSYDNNNGSTTVPIVKDDGSVQLTTIIASASAPTEYPYKLALPAGATMSLVEGGAVEILNADGTFLAGVSAAWAKDTSGASVPTKYVLNGETLTQVVDLSGDTISFPVVADPWLNIALILRTSWSGATLNVFPTNWARINPWASAGFAARWAGWDEVLSKTPGNRENTPSMRDQFYCHFDFVRWRAPNKVSWNLDASRPYVSYWDLINKQCNA